MTTPTFVEAADQLAELVGRAHASRFTVGIPTALAEYRRARARVEQTPAPPREQLEDLLDAGEDLLHDVDSGSFDDEPLRNELARLRIWLADTSVPEGTEGSLVQGPDEPVRAGGQGGAVDREIGPADPFGFGEDPDYG